MPEPRTLEEQQAATIGDHERRLRKLESLECPIGNLIPFGEVGCTDLTPLLGDFGICNGQFELGPTATHPVACNWIEESLGGAASRVTGGVAGDWCIKLESGTGTAVLRYDRYLCVWESRDYYVACHANGPNGTETFQLGAHCYDATKAFLATVWAHNAVLPAGWDPIQRRIGPNGDVAWPQGTRYCRPLMSASTKAETIYVDDMQFQQMKAAYSPGIRLMDDRITVVGPLNYTLQAWVLIPGTAMTITFEEPGYLWYFYRFFTRNTVAARNASAAFLPYIDAVADGLNMTVASPNQNDIMPIPVFGRSQNILAAGAHTVDLRCFVSNAGDTQRVDYVEGMTYYTRAW